MSAYPLRILTYDRGQRWDDPTKKKPYHWLFLLGTSSGSTQGIGSVFQLHGMPGAFYYVGEEHVDDLAMYGVRNGELEVGSVPTEKFERFKEILEGVGIEDGEASGWNCQSWCVAALDLLREEGFVGGDYSNDVIRNWLRE